MASNDLLLGLTTGSLALLSAFGRKYNITTLEQARAGRTASGRFVKDIIADKKLFSLSYSLIDNSELQKFISYYNLKVELVFRDIQETGYTDYTVLIAPIDRDRIIASSDSLWGNVLIELEEV